MTGQETAMRPNFVMKQTRIPGKLRKVKRVTHARRSLSQVANKSAPYVVSIATRCNTRRCEWKNRFETGKEPDFLENISGFCTRATRLAAMVAGLEKREKATPTGFRSVPKGDDAP